MPNAVLGETSGDMETSNRPRPLSPENNFYSIHNAGRESLRQYLIRLYGEETSTCTKQLEKQRKKKYTLLSSLAFLRRCRDEGTTPNFLRTKRNFNSAKAHRIYNRTERALLRERIHQTQKDLAATDLTLYHLHLKLSNILTVEDWNKIDVLTHQSAQNTFIQVSD